MKTEEKKEMSKVAQVVFRSSTECHGYYRFHYGRLTPDNTFAEESELTFWEFLESLEVPDSFVSILLAGFPATEKAVCCFGYFAQERFDEFVRHFAESSVMVQL